MCEPLKLLTMYMGHTFFSNVENLTIENATNGLDIMKFAPKTMEKKTLQK